MRNHLSLDKVRTKIDSDSLIYIYSICNTEEGNKWDHPHRNGQRDSLCLVFTTNTQSHQLDWVPI